MFDIPWYARCLSITLHHGTSGWPLDTFKRREEWMLSCQLELSSCLAFQVEKSNFGHSQFSTILEWYEDFKTSPECPLQRPTPGHLCAGPSGAMECQYPADHCCCGQCFKSLNFSCVTDSVTGAGIWQTTPVCPEEGCGSQGEGQCTRSMCCS